MLFSVQGRCTYLVVVVHLPRRPVTFTCMCARCPCDRPRAVVSLALFTPQVVSTPALVLLLSLVLTADPTAQPFAVSSLTNSHLTRHRRPMLSLPARRSCSAAVLTPAPLSVVTAAPAESGETTGEGRMKRIPRLSTCRPKFHGHTLHKMNNSSNRHEYTSLATDAEVWCLSVAWFCLSTY